MASLAKPSISILPKAKKTSSRMFLDSGHRNGNGSNNDNNNSGRRDWNNDDGENNQNLSISIPIKSIIMCHLAASGSSSIRRDLRRFMTSREGERSESGVPGMIQSVKRSLAQVSPSQWILFALVAVYILDRWKFAGALFQLGGNIPRKIFGSGQFYRLFTSQYIHANLAHLGANCLTLYNIGSTVEAYYGDKGFYSIYMLGGLTASMASALLHSSATVSVGASGAIFALLGAFGYTMYCNRQVFNSGRQLQNLGRMLLINLAIGMMPGSGIDNIGHASGFISGLVLGYLASPRFSIKQYGGRYSYANDPKKVPITKLKSINKLFFDRSPPFSK